MINAHNFCRDITSKASKLGFKLSLSTHHNGYAWTWVHGGGFLMQGWADPSDKVAALALACEDLAKGMGWQYAR